MKVTGYTMYRSAEFIGILVWRTGIRLSAFSLTYPPPLTGTHSSTRLSSCELTIILSILGSHGYLDIRVDIFSPIAFPQLQSHKAWFNSYNRHPGNPEWLPPPTSLLSCEWNIATVSNSQFKTNCCMYLIFNSPNIEACCTIPFRLSKVVLIVYKVFLFGMGGMGDRRQGVFLSGS